MEYQEITTRTARTRMETPTMMRITSLPDVVQTLADAKENAVAFETIAQGRKFTALLDIRQLKSQDREAREFYSKPGHTPGMQALAILIGNPMSRVIGNFFMGFNKSDIPARLFTSEAEAIQWLRSFPLPSADHSDASLHTAGAVEHGT